MIGGARLHRPRRVPVQVEAAAAGAEAVAVALLGHLAVVLDPGRIRAENKTVLPVAEAVEDDLEGVGRLEVGIAATARREDRARIFVVQDGANVDRLIRVSDVDLRLLRRRLALVWPRLPEAP